MGNAFRTLVATSLGLLCSAAAAQDLPRLRVEGGNVVNPEGKTVILRGVNLGNWLLYEPGGLGGTGGAMGDQHTLFTTLRDRFGEDERWRLMNIYRDSFFQSRDFDNARKFNFNLLRIGFDHELMEDDNKPMQLRPDAFKYLDYAVKEAKARGMYVLLDMHGVQGRAVVGKQSGGGGPANFWTDPKNQERALWLWDQIVAHYKGDTTIIGYEPLNEPWGGTRQALADYCARWYPHVRDVDPDAIAVFPGWSDNIDFYGTPTEHGWTNCMFDMHFYIGVFNGRPSTIEMNARFLANDIPRWQKKMKAINAPLLIGETNVVFKSAGGGQMQRRFYDVAAENGWPITLWTLKEHSIAGGVGEKIWMLTTNRDPLPVVDFKTASKEEIEAHFRRLATIPLVIDDDNLHWLTTDEKPAPLPPLPAQATTRSRRNSTTAP